MRDPNQAIISAISRDDGGIAIIWCPLDAGVRDWLIAEVQSFCAPNTNPVQVATVDEAMNEPNRLVLLVPELSDERDVVLDLNGSRDRILNEDNPRTQPIVLFLFREGEGQRALAEAPSLVSISNGSTPDPEALAEVDVEEERAAFKAQTSQTPEAWLIEWRADGIPHTPKNFIHAYQAMLLESS